MKRTIAFILTVVLLSALLGACAETLPVTVEGALFGGKSDDKISLELVFQPEWLTNEDNTVYNPELARFSAVLAADTYFRDKDLPKGTANRVRLEGSADDAHDRTALLGALGFTDVQFVESFRTREYAFDGNDSATMTLAYAGGDKDVFVAVIRGCFSAQEWASIFDPGADTEAYNTLTGEHPEWTEKECYKGLDIAANRALEIINEYIAAHDDPEKPNCVFVTGHSRGGSIANIVGARLEKAGNAVTRTYTFSCLGVTTDASATEAETVFNIYDSNDFYTDVLPFGSEQFYRYGRDIVVTISESDEIKSAITALTGRNDYCCVAGEVLNEYKTLFGSRFTDRASLYEPVTLAKAFDSAEEAAEHKNLMETLIGSESGLGLEGLCRVTESGNDEKHEIVLEYNGGALLLAYSKVLAYGNAAYEAFLQLFDGDENACTTAGLMIDNAAGITGDHLLVNAYAAAAFIK